MTALLPDISPAGWVGIFVAAWIIVACAVAPLVGRAAKDDEPEHVNWIPVLPPVPPSDCRWCAAFDADKDWLAPWPTNLTDQQVDRLFDDIVAIEGLDR